MYNAENETSLAGLAYKCLKIIIFACCILIRDKKGEWVGRIS